MTRAEVDVTQRRRSNAARAAAVSLLVAWVLACSGAVETGPASPDEAFQRAGVTPPPEAADVRYASEKGDDGRVWLQFVVADPQALRSFLPGCALIPVRGERADPLGAQPPSAPSWWVHDAPDGARGCRVPPEAPEDRHRAVRVDPVDAGFRVQVVATPG